MSIDFVHRALAAIVGGRRGRDASPESPPRILQLIETGGPGGAERVLLSLSQHLRTWYEVEVGLLKPGWLAAQVQALGLACSVLRARGAGDLAVITALRKLVRTHQISLIHAHEFYMAGVGAIVSRLTGIPLVATVHGKTYYPDKRRRRLLYRLIAAQASKIVPVSQDLATFFCRTTGTPVSRVEVIYNGIDVDVLAGVLRDRELLASVGIPPTAPVVGAVGNLYPVKGHAHLLRAMPAVMTGQPAVHLVVLGRGALHDRLLADAQALGIRDRVHLLGHREDVPRWVASLDVFVLPSLSEGLPLSLLEAMATGRPSVVTAVGGVSEVIEDGVTGFIVPPASPGALAEKTLMLLRDSVLSARIGSAAQARVREHFSTERMTRNYRRMYRMLLHRDQRPREAAERIETIAK